MLKRTKWLLGSAAVLAAAAVGVGVAGSPLLVRYPLNVDQKLSYTGTATIYLSPSTATPLASPLRVPLTVDRRVKVVHGNYSQAVVQETELITFAGATHTTTYQYAMNRRDMQLLNGSYTYAFNNPANVMSPAGSYRVNLPFGVSADAYDAFAPETDSFASATAVGPAHHDAVSGDQVVTLNTKLNHAVAPYYQRYLQGTGIPATLSATAAGAELRAAGADPAQVLRDVAPHLTTAQVAQLTKAFSQAVPLNFGYFQSGQLQVQTKTGAVVAVQVASEGVTATPDLSALAPARAILAPFASLPSVQALARATASLSAPQTVFSMAYSQTPASVRSAAATANAQGARMNLIQWQLPIALGAAAVLLLLVALVWRPRPPAATSHVLYGSQPGRKAA